MATRAQPTNNRAVLWTAVMLGIGLVGSFDEIVLHQLLQWHNFYVHADQYWRIFSDGVFHFFTTVLLFLASLRLWDMRRRFSEVITSRPYWAGKLLGIGGFQLFDGTINHKVLQLHPIREGVSNILVYDIVWNAISIVILVAGWLLWRTVDER